MNIEQALAETQLLRVTNLSSAILSVYIDSASELPQVRAQSKPDPFAIISVGKTNQQTAALRRTDAPVWEQGFTFLVANPANDTLQIKLVDQKTEKELGHFAYIMSSLLTKPDLQVVSQPFQLQKAGPTSKIIMSMALKILTRPSNQPIEPAAGEPAIQRQLSQTSQSSVQRQSSQVKRQPSQVSQSDVSEVKSIKLADFPTKLAEFPDEVEQIVDKTASDVTEFISNEAANILGEDTTNQLRKRQLSTQLSGNSSHGLGRIQMSMHYSVDRQRLSVTVHKIM